MRYLLLFLCFATIATAQTTPGIRDNDALLSKADLAAALSGNVVRFYDGGAASFSTDGRYAYKYDSGEQVWSGVYQIGAASEVCVEFDNGFSRCDVYVEDGNRLILITDKGDRFPVKSVEAE
ncbi:MAG: hypothetical protein ABJO67_00240 [Pseudoruegeria sp.]